MLDDDDGRGNSAAADWMTRWVPISFAASAILFVFGGLIGSQETMLLGVVALIPLALVFTSALIARLLEMVLPPRY